MTGQEVFSEQEVVAIIRKAVEVMESHKSPDYQAGVTREELARIAGEVGVTPEALALAIRQVREGAIQKTPGLLGLAHEFEKVLDGEIDPSDFDIILEQLRQVRSRHSSGANQVGRTLHVAAWTGGGVANVNVTSRNGRTRLNVRSTAFFPFMVSLYPALVFAMVGAGMAGEAFGALAGIGMAVAASLVGLLGFRGLVRKGHREAEKVTERLTGALREHLARATVATATDEQEEVQTQELRQRTQG